MTKRIYIGGRFESVEQGNVVAGANAILDDTKGKKQNVINSETDAELLRLSNEKQDNLTFDNAPTEGSNNPVKSGGVYAADKALSDAIEAILLLIPSASTELNKLVDTNLMNSSISTATATFRGTYNVVTDLGLTYQATHEQIAAALDALVTTADNNDYCFVQIPTSDHSSEILKTERYKNNGTNWGYEYDLNTSGFTAAQWAAINSGITALLVGKLSDLPTAAELNLLLDQKQDNLTFDNEPTAQSNNPVKSGGVYAAIQTVLSALTTYQEATDPRIVTIEGKIPSGASSANQLTDKSYVDGIKETLQGYIDAINTKIPSEAAQNNKLADKNYVQELIAAITALIPEAASGDNQLVDTAAMVFYVTGLINAIDASFNVTSTDGHITLHITQKNGAIISVSVQSSDIASAADLSILAGRVTTAEGNITSLTGRVSINETDIANLQQLYNNLQQSKPVPVTALPTSGQQQGVIYRLAGTTSYSDYMWNGSSWVLMATYNNAIDDYPMSGSENLVKSGGVYSSIGGMKLNFIGANYNATTIIPATDRALAEISSNFIFDYEELVIYAISGYKIAIVGSDKPFDQTATKMTLVGWSYSLDILSFYKETPYNFYAVVVKKEDNTDIPPSDYDNLVSVQFRKKTYSESLTMFISPDIVFQGKDFDQHGLIDDPKRAIWVVSLKALSSFKSFNVVPNSGYYVVILSSNDSQFTSPVIRSSWTENSVELKDYNYPYLGVLVKKGSAGTTEIDPSEYSNLITVNSIIQKEVESVEAKQELCYVSPSGSDTNDGSYEYPVKSIAVALQISDNIIFKEGEYEDFSLAMSAYSGRDIHLSAEIGKRVILMNRTIIVNDGSEALVSGYSNVYSKTTAVNPNGKWIYQHLVDDVRTQISQTETHPLQRGKFYRLDSTIIRPVTFGSDGDFQTLADALAYMDSQVASNSYYYCYDANNSVLYFTRPQSSSSSHPICMPKSPCISGQNDYNTLHVTGIDFYYGMVDLVRVNNSKMANCSAKYTNGWGAFHWTDSMNLIFENCEGAGNIYSVNGDGFNGDSNNVPTVDPYAASVYLINCWAHDNNDDGYSDHNGCNCHLIGGLYEYNRKGGVTPAAGSHCTVIGAMSRKNINGFYYIIAAMDQGKNGNATFNSCLAEDNEECGFKIDDTGATTQEKNNAVCINCISINNGTYGFMGKIQAYSCKVKNNVTAAKDADVIVVELDNLQ